MTIRAGAAWCKVDLLPLNTQDPNDRQSHEVLGKTSALPFTSKTSTPLSPPKRSPLALRQSGLCGGKQLPSPCGLCCFLSGSRPWSRRRAHVAGILLLGPFLLLWQDEPRDQRGRGRRRSRQPLLVPCPAAPALMPTASRPRDACFYDAHTEIRGGLVSGMSGTMGEVTRASHAASAQ